MGGPSAPKILYPKWQNEYQVALLELDRLGASNGGRNRDLQSYSGHLARTHCGTASHRRCAGKFAHYKAGESRTSRKTKIVRQPQQRLFLIPRRLQ